MRDSTVYFSVIERYKEFMEDSDIIFAVLELVPYSTRYLFLRTVYKLETEKKLLFRDDNKKQWTSGYIYYDAEDNQIVIEYGDSEQEVIRIPEDWEL